MEAKARIQEFEQKFGATTLHLAYHAALPVVINAEFVHLLRINFFLDPPETLDYTAEFDLLLSPFCHEIGDGLYEIDRQVRDELLKGLIHIYNQEDRIGEIGELLRQYTYRNMPWSHRPTLERAQELTALDALDHQKAIEWLEKSERSVHRKAEVGRQWFVAMRSEIDRKEEIDTNVENMRDIKKILILAANPKDTARLRLDQEVREIEEGLRRSKLRDQFLIQSRWAVRLRDLRRTLLDHEPQIVHFCGHGKEEGLLVEDENGKAVLAPSEALATLFELFKGQIECVLLNACYSQKQAEVMNEYITYVIGMRQGIPDKAGIEFALGFYDALGSGRSYEEAFKFGCNALQLYHLPEHVAPIMKNQKQNSSQEPSIEADTSFSLQTWQYKAGSKISAVAIDAHGETIVAGTFGRQALCLDAEGHLRWQNNVGKECWCLALSPDGQTVIVGTWNKLPLDDRKRSVFCFDGKGSQLWQDTSTSSVWAVAFSADGQAIAAGMSDELVLFDIEGKRFSLQKNKGTIFLLNSWTMAVVLSAHGDTIAAGTGSEKHVYVFKQNGALLGDFRTQGDVYTVAVSANGEFVAAGDTEGFVYWLNQQGKLVWKEQFADKIQAMTFDKEGQQLWIGTGKKDGHLHVYNNLGNLLWRHYMGGSISSLALSASNERAVVGTEKGEIYIFNNDGTVLYQTSIGNTVRSVAISATGERVVAGSFKGVVYGFQFRQEQIDD